MVPEHEERHGQAGPEEQREYDCQLDRVSDRERQVLKRDGDLLQMFNRTGSQYRGQASTYPCHKTIDIFILRVRVIRLWHIEVQGRRQTSPVIKLSTY